MKRAYALCVVVLVALSCRTPVPGTRLAPTDPRPEQHVAALVRAGDARRALRGTAHLDLDGPDLELHRPQRIAVERPARLRVEILGLFGQLAAVLVTDGVAYQVYRSGEPVLEAGRVSADLLWDVARIDLAPEEAVDLLLGVPRPDPAQRLTGAWIHPDGEIVVERATARGDLRERLRFDALGRIVAFDRFEADGGLVLAARFADYRDVATGGADGATRSFAHEVDLTFPRVEATARFRFKQVELADDLPDALFELKLPDRSTRLRGGERVL